MTQLPVLKAGLGTCLEVVRRTRLSLRMRLRRVYSCSLVDHLLYLGEATLCIASGGGEPNTRSYGVMLLELTVILMDADVFYYILVHALPLHILAESGLLFASQKCARLWAFVRGEFQSGAFLQMPRCLAASCKSFVLRCKALKEEDKPL